MDELAAIFDLPGAELGWFVHPWLFMAATVWVIGVLYRREFHSITQRTLKREMG